MNRGGKVGLDLGLGRWPWPRWAGALRYSIARRSRISNMEGSPPDRAACAQPGGRQSEPSASVCQSLIRVRPLSRSYLQLYLTVSVGSTLSARYRLALLPGATLTISEQFLGKL